ncbi:MAG: phosphatidylglycerophosphatase A [Kiloniellales bacterium]
MTAPPLPFWHPASLLATWCGAGLLPKAPGTWGSLAALPCAFVIVWAGGPWALAAAAFLVFLIGLWASSVYAEKSGAEDPQAVVIDEVAGQWIALLPAALDLRLYALAFLAFRFFDIVKVWPARPIDRRLPGAWGIMLDDVVAGLYAAAVVYAASYLFE